jgi:hypothetical protein
MAARDTHATIEELFEAVFSVRSVPRLYNKGQLSEKLKDRPTLSSERAPPRTKQ